MDFKQLLGIIAIIVAFCAYIPYFRNMISGKTKPHAFTWLIWGTLTGIAFAGQVAEHGGAGAWVTGFSAAICVLIGLYALIKGTRDIALLDWISLGGAVIAIGMWFLTSTPLISVILISVIDALGFVPTFRKSFHRPYEETVFTFFVSAIKLVLGVSALSNFSMVTALYPLSLVASNLIFITMVLVRRRQLGRVSVTSSAISPEPLP